MGAAILLLLISAGAMAQTAELYPVAKMIEPRSGVPGTVVRMSGTALDKAKVDEVYLTDHRFNLLVKVLAQEADSITLRIPPFAKPGRYQILFLSNRSGEPVLLEQPLYLTVDQGEPVAAAPVPSAPAPSPAQPVAPAVAVASTPTPAPAPQVAAAQPTPAVRPAPITPAPVVAAKMAPAPEPQRGIITADSGPSTTMPKPVVVSPQPVAPPKPAPMETAQSRPQAPVVPQPVTPAQVHPAETAMPDHGEGSIAQATPVEVLKKVAPSYNAAARQMKLSGAVVLRVMVDPKGAVSAVEVVEGNPILGASATDAVKRWNYKPATLRGAPIAGSMTIRVMFAPL